MNVTRKGIILNDQILVCETFTVEEGVKQVILDGVLTEEAKVILWLFMMLHLIWNIAGTRFDSNYISPCWVDYGSFFQAG